MSNPVVDYSPLLLGSIWALTAVTTMFFSLRIYAKLSRHRSLWWDDYFLIVSWVRSTLHVLAHLACAYHS